ncbi:MAG: HAD-IIIC family phosphatase [Nanoarchaeota archaeon]
MNEHNLSHYLNTARTLPPLEGKAKIKIGLLSNFTIKGLAEIMKVKCHEANIVCTTYEAGYDQIPLEIMHAESGLRKFQPDMTFVILSPRFILGDQDQDILQEKDKRDGFIRQKTTELIELMTLFAQRISGHLVVTNIIPPTSSALGIQEQKTAGSVHDLILECNQKLKQAFLNNNKVLVYDLASFCAKHGEQHICNEKMRLVGDIFISPDYLPHLGHELMCYVKPFCSKNRKCIVLDLDNTLWGGIIGEDGFSKIQLDNKPPGNAFYEFQKQLYALYKRGIILAINSKNNKEDAMEVIRKHPYMVLREEHFASMQINWDDKALNMQRVAEEINIGTDSLVFFDDDKVNRALIRELMPEVLVVELPEDPALYVQTLSELNDLNTLQITEEDLGKGERCISSRDSAMRSKTNTQIWLNS